MEKALMTTQYTANMFQLFGNEKIARVIQKFYERQVLTWNEISQVNYHFDSRNMINGYNKEVIRKLKEFGIIESIKQPDHFPKNAIAYKITEMGKMNYELFTMIGKRMEEEIIGNR